MSFGLAFTYLMSYGGAAVALVNPFVGLLIYVSFAILKPGPGVWYWSVPDGNFSKILALGLLVGWAARGFGDWRLGRAGATLGALLAYFVWTMLSATQALIPDIAWDWVESQGKVILPVVVGITLTDSVAKLKQLAWVILVSHGYVAYDLNMSYVSGFNRLHEIGFGGMDNNCVGITLVSCVGLGLFLGFGSSTVWQRAVAATCVGFLVHAVLFSFSRGAMLGLILVVGISFLLIPKKPIHFLLLFVAIGLTVAAAGKEVEKRFMSTFAEEKERDESAESRLEMWLLCVKVAGDRPVTGLGPHHFPVHASSFGLKPNKEAHTTWLQLAAEVGLPGVTFLLAFYSVTVFRLLPVLRESAIVPDPWLRDTARMVIASTVGFLFAAQFVTLPGLEAPYFIILLGAGALRVMSLSDYGAATAAEPQDRRAAE
jgi:probable O-glycosylation ligase (exosortase A-associated)